MVAKMTRLSGECPASSFLYTSIVYDEAPFIGVHRNGVEPATVTPPTGDGTAPEAVRSTGGWLLLKVRTSLQVSALLAGSSAWTRQ